MRHHNRQVRQRTLFSVSPRGSHTCALLLCGPLLLLLLFSLLLSVSPVLASPASSSTSTLPIVTVAAATATEARDSAGGISGGASAAAYVVYCSESDDDDDSLSAAASPSLPLPPALRECQRKLVVELTLDDGTVAGSVLETDVVVVRAFHAATLPSLAHTTTSNTEQPSTASILQVSLPPIRIAFRRGAVQVRYALSYLRDFTAAVKESVQPLRAATSCNDGITRCPDYTAATQAGKPIVSAPPGLCCLCTGADCALTEDLCNTSMRTHFCFRTAAAGILCAEEDALWYSGWSIGSAAPYYALNMSVSGAGVVPAAFALTTDTVEAADDTSRLQLRRTSGVSASDADKGLQLTERVLFQPLSGQRAASGAAEWMLVPSSLVTVPGTECDKVGVTPEHFYSLSERSQCNAQNGTCLGNQLEDLRRADLAHIAQGSGGSYMAANLGSFTTQHVSETQQYLMDVVERTGGATLRWTAVADALSFTPIPVNGNLTAVRYSSSTAQVIATVQNAGDYAGLYYVALRNCFVTHVESCGSSSGSATEYGAAVEKACVVPLLIRGHNASSTAVFQMWSGASIVGGTAGCTAELRDAVNATLMSTALNWAVAQTTTTPAPPQPQPPRCQHCGFADVRCLFSDVCEWQMLVWTAVALAVSWCPYVLLAYWRCAWQLCQAGAAWCRCG